MSKRLVLGQKKKKEEDFDDESPAFLLSDPSSSSSDDDEPVQRAFPPAPTAPPPLLPRAIRIRAPSPSSSSESESEDEEPKYHKGKRTTPQVARAAPQQEGLHAIAKRARRIAEREDPAVSQDQLQRALSLSALESRARQIEELRGEVQIRQAMIASLQDVQAREQSAFSAEEARRAERAQAWP